MTAPSPLELLLVPLTFDFQVAGQPSQPTRESARDESEAGDRKVAHGEGGALFINR